MTSWVGLLISRVWRGSSGPRWLTHRSVCRLMKAVLFTNLIFQQASWAFPHDSLRGLRMGETESLRTGLQINTLSLLLPSICHRQAEPDWRGCTHHLVREGAAKSPSKNVDTGEMENWGQFLVSIFYTASNLPFKLRIRQRK